MPNASTISESRPRPLPMWRRALGGAVALASALAVLAFPLPGLDVSGQRMAALAVAVIVLWISEALPIAVTSLAIPVAASAVGIAPAKAAFAPFAHPLIFLFMGGFILAQGLRVQGVDRRLTLWILSRPGIGSSPQRTSIAIASAAFVLSMWISNAATAALLLPIALSIGARTEQAAAELDASPEAAARADRFTSGSLLALAYGASLGGMATPVGTAPNVIAIGTIEDKLGRSLDFAEWVTFALPVAIVMFLVVLGWTRVRFPAPVSVLEHVAVLFRSEYKALGPMRIAERRTVAVFACAAIGWLAPTIFRVGLGADHAATKACAGALDEGAVAIGAALLLCVIPGGTANGARQQQAPLLEWDEAMRIDWATLFLLGGSFCLSELCFSTGVAQALSDALLGDVLQSPWLLLASATVFVLLLTEVASNTATTAMMLPILITLTKGSADSLPLLLSVTLAASCAFMLPIGTPPNAMVYGTGRVPIARMIGFGALLDLAGALVLIAAGIYLLPRVLG